MIQPLKGKSGHVKVMSLESVIYDIWNNPTFD
jgi:hypothetical protein